MLAGTVETATASAQAFDTDSVLTEDDARAFAAQDFGCAIRYLSRTEPEAAGDLSNTEAQAILAGGLALMAVQHVAPAGWVPSEALGAQYGASAASNAQAIGLPAGVSVWLDLEGVAPGTAAEDVTDYANAWYAAVSAAGYFPGLYVGAECGLDGEALFADLLFERYWQSGSQAPQVAVRGYCLVQTIAGAALDGVSYDGDLIQADQLGGLPAWLAPAV